jgi:glucan 1,3-beta-glucosidase
MLTLNTTRHIDRESRAVLVLWHRFRTRRSLPVQPCKRTEYLHGNGKTPIILVTWPYADIAQIQTESPYYPPFVIAPAPFTSSLNKFAYDPTFSDCGGAFPCSAAWALTISNSNNIQVTGAGLYVFYQNYNLGCIATQNCQQRLVATSSNGAVYLFNVYTIGSIGMVHPFVKTVNGKPSSTLGLALAAPNTINTATPFVAAINAWVEIFPGW